MAGSISKEALLKITGDSRSAEEALDKINLKADELEARRPELKPQIDKARVLAQAAVLRDELKRELKVTVDVDVKTGFLSKIKGLFGTGGSGLSGSLGGAPLVGGLLNSTGIYGLAGVAAAIAALLPLVVGVASGVTAATAGIGALGVLAIPTINAIKNAYTGVQTAQKGV